MAAVRHKLREQAMTSLYQHLLLKKIFERRYMMSLGQMKLILSFIPLPLMR